jgi:hypothetical protein
MNQELRVELSEALRNNTGQLEKVFALLEAGMETNREFLDAIAYVMECDATLSESPDL